MNLTRHGKPRMVPTTNTPPTATMGWRRRLRVPLLAWLAAGILSLEGTVLGQAVDRVQLVGGTSVAGSVVAVSPVGIDMENSDGTPQTIAIETIREVQFGAEPQSLKNARTMLLRGRGADARDEVAKIDADELDGVEPLVLAAVERRVDQDVDTCSP